MIPSIADCPVPCLLSNRCLVAESFTATTGNRITPSFSIARKRITPVVVSSVEPIGSWPGRSLSSIVTRSAPSSMVTSGSVSRTARRWA